MPDTFKVEGVDCAYLKFDPNDSKFYQKITADIPAFAEYESEYATAESTKVRLFSYIVLMYDMNTPLRREIQDLYKRKVYAANLCGIKPNATSGKYREYVENILAGVDRDFNDLIVKYIASFSSPEYKQLMAHVTIQDQMLGKIVANEADKTVQQMFDTATEKVKELTNLLYGSGERDEVYEARRALYKQVAYDLSAMRPEFVARAVADGLGLPDEWNPYGPGYIPGEMHFVGDNPEIAKADES